ncbi:MAG TPA: AI-2E family transporter [Acetobacteraceae bacterium]|nr:AI-2E family transporter [Acetobacteraceae bacterium]
MLIAGAIVIAALRLGRDLIVPLVLAVLLAFVLAPLVRLLRRLRVPEAAAVLLTMLLAIGMIVALAAVVTRETAALVADLPALAAALRQKLEALRVGEWLRQVNAIVEGISGTAGSDPPTEGVAAPAVPAPSGSPLAVVAGIAAPLLAPLATAGIVLIFAGFVLMFREDLRDRLIRLAGSRDLHRTMLAMGDAALRLSRLFLSQVALNALFGLFIAGGLWTIGVPGSLLWGALAGVMRFVPFVGTPISIMPPLLLALASDPGWSMALGVALLFLVSQPLMGQVFEPLVFGRSTGLSPVSVILSATFWTFMWGPIGLLLAVPLTVLLVVLGRHVPRLEFLEVMLGDQPPLRPEESFYQRALEGNADALVAQARAQLRMGGSLTAWHDDVALRGLALAEADWSREVLEPERLEVIRTQVETLLDDLIEEAAPGPADEVQADWAVAGAVLCVPGRGRLDDLAASVAAQALAHNGFGALVAAAERADPAAQRHAARLCCLSVLEEGSSAASVRFFLRRIRRSHPQARIIVALWHAPADSPILAELRGEGGGAETIVTSLREVLAFCQAAADSPRA